MGIYRKKPIVIEAFQMTKAVWDTHDGWPQWASEAWSVGAGEGGIWYTQGDIYCGTLEGIHRVHLDDWIIQGIKGEIYPCKPDIFEATYEEED